MRSKQLNKFQRLVDRQQDVYKRQVYKVIKGCHFLRKGVMCVDRYGYVGGGWFSIDIEFQLINMFSNC